VGILTKNYPVAACDFMVAHGVRGRGFNQLRSGGYLLWRFWPQTERLPFMDVHQAGTPEIRRLYVDALVHEPGWRELDRRFRFDWALLSRPPPPGDRMLDFLDADSSWALVFVDDAAALYVKRTGPLAAVGSRFDYRVLGAGQTKLERVAAACATDTLLRARVRDELRRQIADSRQTALSHSLLANLAMVEQRFDEARAELTRALEKDPGTPQAYLRLGTVALATGQPYAALEALERERRRGSGEPGLDLRLGLAYQQLGDIEKARRAYRRELKRDPSNLHVIELLRELDVGAPR
jgi:tetratricopeptide (TPR) repeat protein